MTRTAVRWGCCLLLSWWMVLPVDLAADERLVFGSFQSAQNARNWASRVSVIINTDVVVEKTNNAGGDWHRVVTLALAADAAVRVRRAADSRQLNYWRLMDLDAASRLAMAAPERPSETVRPAAASRASSVVQMFDLDLGVQARTFFKEGLDGQSRFHPSISLKADYYRAWDGERQSLTFSPFFRYDAEDEDRTHFDIREGFWSIIGDDWDFSLGVKQVFWGVTEFNHLVDVINQTDLVENIDGEDKLGQPMAHLSLLRSWGILDFYLLTGFRERTFPGVAGRPRFFIPIDNNDATYESGAGQGRIDAAVRWSHHIGAFEFGLYQFSGTSRAPLYDVVLDTAGELLLRPRYPVIDQTGLDAQAVFGDWSLKLEAINRVGFIDRYYAFNAGFERTLVGAFGSRADLGIVVEYLYDGRGDEAFDTFFENDLALATRWQLNDLGDTQALIGLVWDTENNETILTLEASRRLGETWTLLLEGRAFTGAAAPDLDHPFDQANLGASVAKDDYIELELTRYF